jgi:hypothetical protein
MWSSNEYKRVFYAVGFIGIIICFALSASKLVSWPMGDPFSELYVLGPGHMASNYPFNVSEGENYLVYLGVGNHLGVAAYYGVYVKFGNASDVLPNSTVGVSSPLPLLYEYRVFLTDGQTWEAPLSFSFSDVVFDGNVSFVRRIMINGAMFNVEKTAGWDNSTGGFYFRMLAELWVYDVKSDSFGFNSRFVSLWLNVTSGV